MATGDVEAARAEFSFVVDAVIANRQVGTYRPRHHADTSRLDGDHCEGFDRQTQAGHAETVNRSLGGFGGPLDEASQAVAACSGPCAASQRR